MPLFVMTPASAQDVEFLQAVERAQKSRPKNLTSSAHIAPVSEPGVPLTIHGRAFQPDGRTPAHVHVMIEQTSGTWQSTGILFEGDPLISADERQGAARAGRFGTVRPVEVRSGVEHVSIDLRQER